VRRLRLTLEYDGSDFVSWQVQAAGRSVQGVVEGAVERVTGVPARVIGASRTDAGVHARGQVAHVDCSTRLRAAELQRALNAVLPGDVGVAEVREAEPSFHAQRDALSKRYVYRILVGGAPSPLRRRRVWHVRGPLRLEAMGSAAAALEGCHDFAAFRGAPGGPPPDQDTRRTLERLEIRPCGDEVRLVAEGRSFLRYMVRNLAGTLVAVGLGRLPPEAVADILASRDRARAGATAPARGLCLERIRYGGEPAGSATGHPCPG
jgi:tRNA pseudouridine38-40 synthase